MRAPFLLKQYVYAPGHQCGNQPIVAIQGIGKHHIARAKACQQTAHQSELATAFAAMRPYRRIQRHAGGQTNHHDQPRQRESNASCLRAGLGVRRLVLRGVGHRQSGAIHQLDRTTSPTPWLQRPLAEHLSRLTRQRADHLNGQPLARETARKCASHSRSSRAA